MSRTEEHIQSTLEPTETLTNATNTETETPAIYLCDPEDIANASREYLKTAAPEKNPEFTIPEGKYLSDNKALMDCLVENCLKGRQRILLVSPCNTGKTTAVLKELNTRLGAEMQVYLFCPYIVQTAQNAQIILRKEDGYGIRPHEVTSAKGSTFVFDSDRPTVAVFDQIKKLLPSKNIFSDRNIDRMMFLSSTVVVIDEVHLLKEQEKFRGETMRIIQEVLDLVVLYGGTGVYLTGTPRKVAGLPFDLTLHCHRIDSNGKRLPAINATSVDVLDWIGTTNHHTSFISSLEEYIRGLVRDGYQPLLHLNSCNAMYRIASQLRQAGFSVATLESKDRKGGKTSRPNSMFPSIVNYGALPKVDVCITTCWIDTGVSILGTLTSGLKPELNDKIVPIYIVRNDWEADLDKITQFFVRIRHRYEKAVIIRSASYSTSRKLVCKDRDYCKELLGNNIMHQWRKADTLNASPYRADMIDLTGKRETEGLLYVNGQYHADTGSIVADLITESYKYLLHARADDLKVYLEKEFGVDVSTGMLSDSENNSRAADQGINVSAQVRKLLASAFQDRPDKAKEALLSHHGLQLRYFDDVRNEIGGVNVLDTLRKLLISDSTPIEEAIDTAIMLTENGGETLQNDEGLIVSPSQIASDHAIRAFKDLDSYAISIIEDYVNNKLHHDARHSILEGLSDDILTGKISILAADKTALEKLIWICFMRKLPKFSNKWSELCTFAADNSLLYCQMYQRLTQFTEFNDITPTSERYSRIVNPVDSRTGAEYDIVRYPINHTVLLKRGDRKPVESYIGKTITAEACAYIAQQMNDQVRGATRRSQPYRKYSPEEIMWAFKCIYYYKKSGNSWYDSHGYERIVITGKRKGGKVFDFLGEARKKGTFHEECERILLDRRSRSINNRRYAYEAIHKKLHEFGYSEDVCKTVLDNIVPILNNNRNNTYRLGMVKEWLDEAKK